MCKECPITGYESGEIGNYKPVFLYHPAEGFLTYFPYDDTVVFEVYSKKKKYAAKVTSENIYNWSWQDTVSHNLSFLFNQAIDDDETVLDVINCFAKQVYEQTTPKYATGGLIQGSNSPYNYKPYFVDERRPEVDSLPALKELVKYPGKVLVLKGRQTSLENAIINLNDKDKWTREQIADWLETLDVDIRFNPKENNDQD